MAFWSKKEKREEPKPLKSVPPTEKVSAPKKPQENTLGRIKHILAVAAGKGGVGKSTVSVNLAQALKSRGFKVGLLDADIHGPSVPIMMKLATPTEMNGELVVPPLSDGIKVISPAMFSSQIAHIMRGPMAGNFIRQLLLQADWGELDFLIIDYPPGTGDIQLTLSQVCNISAAIIVSTPQDVALADVRKANHMFETLKVPVLGVVETMSWFICDQCEKKHFIFKKDGAKFFAQTIGAPLLGQIPLDPGITECGDSGQSVVSRFPDSASGRAFFDATDAVIQELSHLRKLSQDGLLSFSLKWQ
jgi:ATP-binding protein involved in chromosome partitioning